MEPTPRSCSDGLHPQEHSPCSLPTALNLTKKSEESMKTSSIEGLRVVKQANWYNIGPGCSKVLAFPENDSDHVPQPSQQIQPDDSFCNTTVTLSYVSRSRVFSSPDSLPQLPPICGGVPSMNRKVSQLSPSREVDTLTNEAGRGLCMEINQCFLQRAAHPVGLTSQSELFETGAEAQLMGSIAGACCMQQALDMNRKQDAKPTGVEKLEPVHIESPSECNNSQERGVNDHLHNGTGTDLWNLASCGGKSGEIFTTNAKGESKKCDSEVVFLISRTEEQVTVLDSEGSKNLCNSLNGEYVSPLEDPLSPPATSIDEVDVFALPQTLGSPTGEHFTGEASNFEDEKSVEQEPVVDHPVTESVPCVEEESTLLDSCSVSDVMETPITSNGLQVPPVDLLAPCYVLLDSDSNQLESKERLTDVPKKEVPADPLINVNALLKDRTFKRKKLPPRSRRGMKLEAIVQNISPSRYKVSRNFHSTKKGCGPKTLTCKMNPVSLDLTECRGSLENTSGSEKEPNLQTAALQKLNADNTDTVSQTSKNSSSDSEYTSVSKPSCGSASLKPSSPLNGSPKRFSDGRGRLGTPTTPKACEKSPAKAPTDGKAIPTAKKAHSAKRKKKKRKAAQSSMFSPQEPEIKLKYVNYKEEKRDRADTFSPFIRMEVKEFSTCTVINYAEEENARLRKGQLQACAGFIPGVVPTTSCLQLGRVSTKGKWQSGLVCCLCGRSANAMDLGDLHGPYYPEDRKPDSKARVNPQDLKEEDYSDSDSSCSMPGGKRARTGGSWSQKPCQSLERENALGSFRRWASDSDGFQCPSTEKPWKETAANNWYNPPVLALDTEEYWLHEDCGIWSAGVYLVKGKVYGLEEAVRLAQETICSTCHEAGATLGCFFKGCPNKYHYHCAIQSDCVLNEENFSMKCTKHKNKSFKGSTVNRLDTR